MHPSNDLYQSLKPIFILSTVLGVFPMFPVKIAKQYSLYTSRKLHLTTFILATIYSLCFSATIIQRSNNVVGQKFYKHHNKVSNFGLTFEFIFGIIILYTIYLMSFVRTKRVKAVMVTLHKIDAAFKRFGQSIDYKTTVYYQIFVISSGLVIIALIAAMQIQNIRIEKFSYISLPMWILFLSPVVVLYDLNTQFGITAVLIYQRFKMIGQQLDIIRLKQNAMKQTEIIHRIVELSRMHALLCKAANGTNSNYNVQMLPSLAHQFFISLYAIFYFYWMFSSKPFSACCWLAWGFLKVYEMFHVSIACHLASEEAQVVGRKVHKMLIKTRNEDVEDKLLMFSKQISHGRFNFSLCGLFNINAGLLTNMISSSTTFIVIMIQFQETMSPPVCYKTTITN